MAEKTTINSKAKKKFIVALPLTGVNVRGYYSMEKVDVTSAASERQAVAFLIARQKRDTGLIMNVLDNDFGGAGRFAFEVPEFFSDDELSVNQYQILQEMQTAHYLSSVYGGNPRAYFSRAGRILKKAR